MTHCTEQPCPYMRVNITAQTSTTQVSVYVHA